MSFKLIARDNKINIYDPYSDKYHVIEDDDELSKILDSDGKLISDEQLRQYFASKESKSRKIQKGFVSRKANLKKEYTDVAKQTFNDVVKSKLYSTYGDILSNDDINAFNKNPSIVTIKGFKSINKDIKNDIQNLFKSNEATFNQDFQDKNNFASVLSELQTMNSAYIDNIYNFRNLGYMTMKKDVETLKVALQNGDEDTANKMVQNIKNTIASIPSVDTKLVKLVNEVKENPDELNKVLQIEIDKNDNKSKQLDATKYLFKSDDVTMYGEYRPGKDGFEQFNNVDTIKKFKIVPLKTLYKNLSFINKPDVFDTKPTIEINDNEDNTTSYHINFGKNGKIKFDYTINNDTPYFDRMKPVIDKLQDDIANQNIEEYQKDFQSLKDSIITVDAGDYVKTYSNEDLQNSYKFTNPYSADVNYDELYQNLDNIPDENDLDYKMVMQIESPMFNPYDFEKYVSALETANWFKTNGPQIKFNKTLEHHAFNETSLDKDIYENPFIHTIALDDKGYKRHMYKNSVKSTINNDITKSVETIIDAHNQGSDKKWNNDEAKMLGNIIKAYIYQKGMDYDDTQLVDLKQIPLSVKDTNHFDTIYSFKVPLTNSMLDDIKILRDEEMFNKPTKKQPNYTIKKSYVNFLDEISNDENDKNMVLGAVNKIREDMFRNLDNAYYWYYKDTTSNYPFELYVPGKTKDVSRIRPLDPSNKEGIHSKAKKLVYNKDAINKYQPINTIESDIYIPYGRKYLHEDDFLANGVANPNHESPHIRDMLILKLNSSI